MAVVETATAGRPKKKLLRKRSADRSQALRRGMQAVFLALNVWIGVQFYLFVRYYESGGHRVFASGRRGWRAGCRLPA